jgi:hypothetical protein
MEKVVNDWESLRTREKVDIIAEKLNIKPGEVKETVKRKDKEYTVKFFKPSFGWFKEAGMKKGNKVYVFYLKQNGFVQNRIEKIDDGMIEIDGKCHDATDSFKYVYKNKPCYIIPEWRVHPFGNVDLEEAIKTGSIIHPQVITIRRIEKAILENKKSDMTWLWWVLIIGVVGVVGYLLISGNLFGASAAANATTVMGG